MQITPWFSLGLFALIAAIVVLAGIKKQPGIGIILAVIILGVAIGFDKLKLSDIGFSTAQSWLATILWGIGLGIVIAFVYTLFNESVAELTGNQIHDLSILENMRGNWKQLLLILAVAWFLASFLEESIFRGFLMTALGSLFGLLLGNLFIWGGYNIWMPIMTHGVIDTISLILINSNQDAGLIKLFLKEKT